MIVCHCNRIDHRDIEDACADLDREAPWSLLTPTRVYKKLGRRPRCGGCLSLATSIIHGRRAGNERACQACPLAALGEIGCAHASSGRDIANHQTLLTDEASHCVSAIALDEHTFMPATSIEQPAGSTKG